jgi:hypothetical protein
METNSFRPMTPKSTAAATPAGIAVLMATLTGRKRIAPFLPAAQVVIDWADELRDRGSYDEVWRSDVLEAITEALPRALRGGTPERFIEAFLADADWSDDDPFQNGEGADDDDDDDDEDDE